jgi:hypothetical protein
MSFFKQYFSNISFITLISVMNTSFATTHETPMSSKIKLQKPQRVQDLALNSPGVIMNVNPDGFVISSPSGEN